MPRSRCGNTEVGGQRSEVGGQPPTLKLRRAKAAYAEATARQGGRGSESRSQKRTTFIHFGVSAKITSQNWRSDLVQVWLIRESKTKGIASYFADFASEVSAKDGLKLRCKNVKLFLRET